MRAARASLNPKVAAYSKLRYISLKHLEQAIAANQGVPTAEMRNLAGLLRLRYVFLYPDSKDIVSPDRPKAGSPTAPAASSD